MQNPDTAHITSSIWKSFDRTTFDQQIRSIDDKKYVAGRRTYPSGTFDDDSYALPLKIEQGSADDLAFIAACEPKVDFVSAVTIEQGEGGSAILVKLVANQGVSADVHTMFDKLFELLRKHARKEIETHDCQDEVFDLIVRLNSNKILGRLGSARFRPPEHLHKLREPLYKRIRQLYASNLRSLASNPDHLNMVKLDDEIKACEKSFAKLEKCETREVIPNIKRAIHAAFVLTENGKGLPTRLRALGFPESVLEARDVREIGKVSNYWRIARHLALCSRRFRSSFAAADWRPISNYKASTTSKTIPRQYVHAEIQLLVHFELHPTVPMPRAIGVSKEACFLCDSFIRAHGQYAISGAHRQMFPQWTIPDLKEYSPQTVGRFRGVLSSVFQEVNKEHRKALRKRPWRPFPPQSAINLLAVQLATPSASTLPLQSGNRSDSDPPTNQTSGAAGDPAVRETYPDRGPSEHSMATGEAFSIDVAPVATEEGSYVKDQLHSERDVPINITTDEELAGRTGWIEPFASFTGPSVSSQSTPPQESFVGASVSLESAAEVASVRTIRLADLQAGVDLVLVRDASDAPHELEFVLLGNLGQRVRFRCRWHIA